MEPRRAVLYARLSKTKHDEGENLDRQLARARDLATRHGWRVVAEFTDEDRSAYNTTRRREGYQALLAMVDAGGCC